MPVALGGPGRAKPEIIAAHCRSPFPLVTHTVRSKADDIWSFGSGWTGLPCAGITKFVLHLQYLDAVAKGQFISCDTRLV